MKEFSYANKRNLTIMEDSNYQGYHYVILDLGIYPTAYVEIPESHTYFGYVTSDIDIAVHGGITWHGSAHWEKFKNDARFFIGWDYGHYGDYMNCGEYNINIGKIWTFDEVLSEVHNVIKQLKTKEQK